MSILPPYLRPGDKVGVVAPARKVIASEMEYAIQTLVNWNLVPVLGSNIYKQFHQFSSTQQERVSDFQQMLNDPSIKAIIAARGGYGTLQIIDELDFSLFQKNPKWIVGYSDITVLHSHIHAQYNIATMHATMLINFTKDEESTQSLKRALFGESLKYEVEKNKLNKKGQASGALVGGNLSILYALNGSVSDIHTDGKILFIEDLDEYLYHIDRMMMNLERSGKLKKLAGLIVGGMNDMKDNAVPFGKTAEEIISEKIKKYNYPVCFNFPAGHDRKNLALLLGKEVKLEVTESVSVLSI
ncbi:MAG: LD-carboxypeptidase [Bacteroidetes bacterium]|nr:LD-carboxypeptidase [Bacteroidota bacterium]MBV6461379.1 putative murein peptide carboxypeptidase [Flavobacteriales bacterium]WKZ75220.1 MAG: LD-carboxypeptidase [Vicingaceae bacterium]MCL4816487.1 LD-carboxypeptidase [Flavobacteriales bacterium]NOG94417.1 LD-carboxypeptidase [Bacteroidota bacterium]